MQGPGGNVLTIKTVQIAPFRTLMTALKDILLETNITFQPDGIRIINMDKSHTILAHLFLKADKFEVYECHKDKIIIGVNMFHLFKLINSSALPQVGRLLEDRSPCSSTTRSSRDTFSKALGVIFKKTFKV